MGLDIYLYRYDKPRAKVEAENEAWEAVTSAIWDETVRKFGDSKNWTPEQSSAWKAETRKAAKKNGRVGKWDDHPSEVKIEQDSAKYPNHMFKIGYFRSSYNSGGINCILRDRIGQDLYSILGLSHDEYCQQPNWGAAIKRIDSAMEQYEALLMDNPWRVVECAHNMFSPKTRVEDKEALVIAQKELGQKRSKTDFTAYSNNAGFWCPEGMMVYGAVNGVDALGSPACFLITKDGGGPEGLRWYLHAMEIVKETAEWVLSQKDKTKYWLHVSG